MMKGRLLLAAVVVCAGLALPACMSAPRPASPAFFAVLPQDAGIVQALVREQEYLVQTCAAEQACPRAHYLRGLAALYEDRAAARTHFQAVLASEPDGPYAASSRLWLLLLDDGRSEPAREARLVHVMDRVVRQLLEGEAAIRKASLAARAPARAAVPPKEAQAVQSLRQQLRDREKEIDKLTQQIEALKRVDQEVREQVKPGRRAK